jgi:hypothetical protein
MSDNLNADPGVRGFRIPHCLGEISDCRAGSRRIANLDKVADFRVDTVWLCIQTATALAAE